MFLLTSSLPSLITWSDRHVTVCHANIWWVWFLFPCRLWLEEHISVWVCEWGKRGRKKTRANPRKHRTRASQVEIQSEVWWEREKTVAILYDQWSGSGRSVTLILFLWPSNIAGRQIRWINHKLSLKVLNPRIKKALQCKSIKEKLINFMIVIKMRWERIKNTWFKW